MPGCLCVLQLPRNGLGHGHRPVLAWVQLLLCSLLLCPGGGDGSPLLLCQGGLCSRHSCAGIGLSRRSLLSCHARCCGSLHHGRAAGHRLPVLHHGADLRARQEGALDQALRTQACDSCTGFRECCTMTPHGGASSRPA